MFTTGTFNLKITKNPGTIDVKSFCVQNISSTQKDIKKTARYSSRSGPIRIKYIVGTSLFTICRTIKKIRTNDFKMPTVDILTAESVGTIEDCPGQRKQQDYSLWRLWWG